MMIRVLSLLLAAMLMPATSYAQRSCAPLAQAVYVRDVMEELYLWHREIPRLDVTDFATAEQYLNAARYRPLDSTFSYITTSAANTALYSSSEYVGFGFSNAVGGDDLRVTQVFPAGPAADAGLRRGDRIIEIDGQSVATAIAAGTLSSAIGPAEVGISRELVIDRDGARSRTRLTKRAVTIPTVSLTQVIDVGGRKVGYVFFRNFVEPSVQALDSAFAELREAGVTELVLDVRYNGGGLVSVAQHLADLIGGTLTSGQVFAAYTHNDRNASRNRTLRFASAAQALSLSRVIMITSRASASASELVANSLRPYMPVALIGDRTYGKPVGQYSFTFCEKVLALVSFSLKNANGEADYFDGLPATCQAQDDVARQLGDPLEASLHEALVYIHTGGCSSTASMSTQARPAERASPPADGWQALVGAN